MHPTLSALGELLATGTGKSIKVLDAPTDRLAGAALSVWAWKVGQDRRFQHAPADLHPGAAVPRLNVHCLVFAPELETLELVSATLWQNPVMFHGDQKVLMEEELLETSLLLNVFLAAKLKPRPCLSLLLSTSAA